MTRSRKSGLIKDYEPLIRDKVTNFCKQYPRANREHVLSEAVLLASKALRRIPTLSAAIDSGHC